MFYCRHSFYDFFIYFLLGKNQQQKFLHLFSLRHHYHHFLVLTFTSYSVYMFYAYAYPSLSCRVPWTNFSAYKELAENEETSLLACQQKAFRKLLENMSVLVWFESKRCIFYVAFPFTCFSLFHHSRFP